MKTDKQKDYAIYPDIKERLYSYAEESYECETWLRVFHKGKHYLWRHRQMGYAFDKARLLDVLHKSVYLAMKFGEPDPNITYSDGTPMLELHENQELERTRLIKHYNMQSM